MNSEISAPRPRGVLPVRPALPVIVRRVREEPVAPLLRDWETQTDCRNVKAMAANSGTCWLLTGGGVIHLRWDDKEWVFSRYASEHGLPDLAYTTITVDRFGRAWLGSREDGMVVRVDGKWVRLTIADGLPSNQIDYLTTDADNIIWLSCDQGVYYAAASEGVVCAWRAVDLSQCGLSRLKANVVASNGLGDLFLGTDWGLIRLNREQNRYRRFTMRDGLPSNQVTALGWAGDETIWVGSTAGLAYMHQDELKTGILEGKPVQHIAYDGETRSHWFASPTELWQLQAGQLRQLPLPPFQPPTRQIRAVVGDGKGHVVMGLDVGLAEISPQRNALALTANVAAPNAVVQALAADQLGRIWAATASGLYVLHVGKWRVLQAPNELAEPLYQVKQIIAAADRSVWVSSWANPHGGVRCLKGHGVEVPHKGARLDSAETITLDDQDRLWAAQGARIWRYDGRQWQDITDTPNSSSLANVLYVVGDIIWCGMSSGLYVRPASEWQPIIQGSECRAIVADSQDRFWAGGSAGVYLLSKNGTTYTAHIQYNCDVWCLCPAPTGALWIGTSTGLLCLREQDDSTWHITRCGPLRRRVTALVRSTDGTLWLGTQSGLASLKNSDDYAVVPLASDW